MAVRAADTGEAFFQVTAFQIGPDHIGNDWPVKTIVAGKQLVIVLLKPVKMVLE